MAEKKFFLGTNGQELQQADVNTLGEVAGYADDRTLWELIRTIAGSATPTKWIFAYGTNGSRKQSGLTSDSTAIVHGNLATGSVRVMPFRAIIGPTDITSPIENMRGVRSGYHMGPSVGSNFTSVSLAANSSGNPRWDLIYASVTPDSNDASVTRYKKDPTTLVVSSTSVPVTKSTTVVINSTTGTPAASPTRPSLPADAAGTYHIAIAYVWVPNGHGAASTVLRGQIYELAPCIPIQSSVGAMSCQPANSLFKSGGAVDVRQTHQQALRPGAYLPSTMVGGEQRIILLQRGLSPLSHNDGDVVDDSIDWRFRYFRWQIHAFNGTGTTAGFASDRNATGTTPAGGATLRTQGQHLLMGHGQSFIADSGTLAGGDNAGAVLHLTNADLSDLGGSTTITLYVRNTDGAIVFKQTGTGTYQAIVWLEATGIYSNFGLQT